MIALFVQVRAWLFRPDMTVTADPLDPDPATIAAGLSAAFRLCATEDRTVRVLVSRVPGTSVSLAWHAVRREVRVECSSSTTRRSHTVTLPPFTFGAGPATFTLEADNIRLVLRPGRDGRIRGRRE